MKTLFPGYDTPTAEEIAHAWRHGLFVFDTSALLNLYRYRASTRDETLKVLRPLRERLWIPHHVALEFQRGRLAVIADQNKKPTEVRSAIGEASEALINKIKSFNLETRHSLIHPRPLITEVEAAVTKFFVHLDEVKKSLPGLTNPDPLKRAMDDLFDGRVGNAPADQIAVNGIYAEGKRRFELKIPPGYQDRDKEKKGFEFYMHAGIEYQRSLGDYLIWQQIIEHALAEHISQLIFITDDAKEDWWSRLDVDGNKTIGPRPELRDEVRHRGSVNLFLMYTSDQFLGHAKQFLSASITADALEEVREVSISAADALLSSEMFTPEAIANVHIYAWLREHYTNVKEQHGQFPMFTAREDGTVIGVETVHVPTATDKVTLANQLSHVLFEAPLRIDRGEFERFVLVLTMPSAGQVSRPGQYMYMRNALDEIVLIDDFRCRVVIANAVLDARGQRTLHILWDGVQHFRGI